MKSKEYYSDYTNRCLLIHCTKCAGSSMSKAPFIAKHGSQELAPNSEFIMSMKFRFAFVREPYERFASCALNLGRATPATFERYVTTQFLRGYEEGFAKSKVDWQNLWPASKHLYFNGKLEVDFVGRFENLLADWDKVCQRIEDDFELPHENKSRYTDYDQYYTPKLRKIVAKAYKEDFENFGYEI